MQGAVNECRQFEFDLLWHLKPMKTDQRLCDVVIAAKTSDRTGSGVQHGLEATTLAGRQTSQGGIAVVQSRKDEGGDERLIDGRWNGPSYTAKLAKHPATVR